MGDTEVLKFPLLPLVTVSNIFRRIFPSVIIELLKIRYFTLITDVSTTKPQTVDGGTVPYPHKEERFYFIENG
jgi:hypothetical protein